MDPKIRQAIQKTIDLEGGYVNDPDDPGGETKYGISKHSYPSEDIPNLTEDRAADLYYRDFWQPLALTTVTASAWKLFDIAVNQGKTMARQYQSEIVGMDDESAEDYLIEQQVKRYAVIVRENPARAKYLVGWVNRAFTKLEGV